VIGCGQREDDREPVQRRGSRSMADTSFDNTVRQAQRSLPQPSLQFVPVSQPPVTTTATADTLPFSDRPVPFEAWTDYNDDFTPSKNFCAPVACSLAECRSGKNYPVFTNFCFMTFSVILVLLSSSYKNNVAHPMVPIRSKVKLGLLQHSGVDANSYE